MYTLKQKINKGKLEDISGEFTEYEKALNQASIICGKTKEPNQVNIYKDKVLMATASRTIEKGSRRRVS